MYSRVGKGAILIFEGLNFVHGNLSEEDLLNELDDGSSICSVEDSVSVR